MCVIYATHRRRLEKSFLRGARPPINIYNIHVRTLLRYRYCSVIVHKRVSRTTAYNICILYLYILYNIILCASNILLYLFVHILYIIIIMLYVVKDTALQFNIIMRVNITIYNALYKMEPRRRVNIV